MNEPAPTAQLSAAAGALRNWPMLTSLSILGLIALLCLIGPLISGHPYDQVYRDYVLVRPSLFAHPDWAEVQEAVSALARRMHVRIEASRDGEIMHMTLEAAKPIDPRALRASSDRICSRPLVLSHARTKAAALRLMCL